MDKVDKTEAEILRAAEELFLQQGFAQTTTAQIAKKAGCNSALVHYYYRTKENLFGRIFASKVGLLLDSIFSYDRQQESAEERVVRLITAHLDFLKANPLLAPFILKEVLFSPERVQPFAHEILTARKRFIDYIAEDLEEEIRADRVRDIEPTTLMDLVLTQNIAFFLLFSVRRAAFGIEPTEAEYERHRQELITTVLARLKP